MIRSIISFPLIKANWKSGLTVALISIPLSISLAVASGVSPISGIITGIWASLIASLFGGSNYNILGPTGALSGIIASYVVVNGFESVSFLAIIAGFFILLAYTLKLEKYLIFIPSSVIHGFTLGVALIISLNQLNFALGLQNLTKYERFIENSIESFKHMGETSFSTFAIFIIFFAGLLVLRAVTSVIPGAIILSPIGILIGYAATQGILPFTIETLGSTFGTIKPQLIQLPSLIFTKPLIMTALVIALIAILETMLSARIADAMTKTKHKPRKEMLGLGLANIVSGLVGGIPATAALARTALNIKTGATHKTSATLRSIFIALGSFLFLSYFQFIPMAVIAAILVYVAVNMIEREHFERLFHHDKTNFTISMLVAAVTVLEDPIIGILFGTVISLLIVIKKISFSHYELITHENGIAKNEKLKTTTPLKDVLIYSFKGKLVYLNSQGHLTRFQSDFREYSRIILLLSDVYFIDLDGVDAIDEIIELVQNRGQKIAVANPSMYIKNMLVGEQFKSLEKQGLVFKSLKEALDFLAVK
ncbi:MAG: SulP family inorganic anion transporter [bacterium]|nr:SulP family inorganic anion transporter [bacterium]